MSNRRAANGRQGIRGPQSALTDFLAANNISARQIRDTVEQRLGRTREQNPDVEQDGQAESSRDAEAAARVTEETSETSQKKRKRKGQDEKTLKAAAKKKAKKDAGDSDSDFEDSFGMDMYQKSRPKPGQFDNCEICSKRFTVTPYSKEGPDGGLLCTPCGKKFAKDNKAAENKAKNQAGGGRKRRQKESNRLDGIVRLGAKSLVDVCIERIAQHHGDLEELGDLPDNLVDRLSQIFSKKRVLTPQNINLFLRPDLNTVAIHDAANLNDTDFEQVFAIAPHVTKLVLRNAGQFKDSSVAYMTEKAPGISFFQVYGANLITDDAWMAFFKAYGPTLETVKIQWCDACFTDEVVECMVDHCPNIQRLKIKYCRKVTPACLGPIVRLKKLRHLSLRTSTPPNTDDLLPVLTARGPQLETLSLENCPELDDVVVDSIRTQCKALSKLRLTDIQCVTDAALASLFTGETAVPPLRFVDFSSARDVTATEPDGPEDSPIGLASGAFAAMMAHSGKTLQTLEMASCRHVAHGALCDAFSRAEGRQYPLLEHINLAFCSGVDTAVVRGIFACCPSIKRIVAFGCFQIEELVVPQGVAVIGVPRAQDAIERIGEAGVDLEQALRFMGPLVSGVA